MPRAGRHTLQPKGAVHKVETVPMCLSILVRGEECCSAKVPEGCGVYTVYEVHPLET